MRVRGQQVFTFFVTIWTMLQTSLALYLARCDPTDPRQIFHGKTFVQPFTSSSIINTATNSCVVDSRRSRFSPKLLFTSRNCHRMALQRNQPDAISYKSTIWFWMHPLPRRCLSRRTCREWTWNGSLDVPSEIKRRLHASTSLLQHINISIIHHTRRWM